MAGCKMLCQRAGPSLSLIYPVTVRMNHVNQIWAKFSYGSWLHTEGHALHSGMVDQAQRVLYPASKIITQRIYRFFMFVPPHMQQDVHKKKISGIFLVFLTYFSFNADAYEYIYTVYASSSWSSLYICISFIILHWTWLISRWFSYYNLHYIATGDCLRK